MSTIGLQGLLTPKDERSSADRSGSTGKLVNVVLWVLQIAAAGMFLMVGFLKLSGNAQLVELFDAIGLGQWFRYLIGALEVVGACLVLIPRTSGLAALMLAGVMVGAVVTHVFIVGGSPLGATILLVVTGVVAWGRRQRTMNVLAWIDGCSGHRTGGSHA
jgi:putative oxidoreductase